MTQHQSRDDAVRGLDRPVASAHRFNRWALVVSGYAVLIPGAFTLFSGERPDTPAFLLLAAALLVATLRGTWVHRALLQRQDGRAAPVLAQVALLAAASGLAMLGASGSHLALWAIVPGSVLSALLIVDRRPSAARLLALAGGLAAPAVAMVFTGVGPAWSEVRQDLLVALGAASCVVVLEHSQLRYTELVSRLNGGRTLAADLAVTKERLRFAGDLHDIQGHSLQVIAVKADLVSRVMPMDPQKAAAEARQIAELAREAMADTRRIAHGYRDTSLAREVVNALAVLRAAGIDTNLVGEPDAFSRHAQALFGRMVREGATNVLRHSRAGWCEIRAHASDRHAELRMRNDGVGPPRLGDHDGSGLVSLRERFVAAGGTLRVVRERGWFELVGSVPARQGGDR